MPLYFERSQRAADQRRVRLRHVAGERQQQRHRVLGGGDDVRLRRVGDDDAAAGGGGDVDVVDADAGAADGLEVVGLLEQLRGQLGRRADQDAVVVADPALELAVRPVDAEVDVETGVAQQLDAGVADLLLDEHLHRVTSPTFSIVQSMQAVSASTSAGSIAGNMPMRSWLRPSLRYGSVSTMPLARSVAAIAAASTPSSKSIVPTTSERLAGSATNGVACSEASAQS